MPAKPEILRETVWDVVKIERTHLNWFGHNYDPGWYTVEYGTGICLYMSIKNVGDSGWVKMQWYDKKKDTEIASKEVYVFRGHYAFFMPTIDAKESMDIEARTYYKDENGAWQLYDRYG